MRYCHVIGQVFPHEDVELILSTEALEELQRAINEALTTYENKEVKTKELYTSDGEGYKIAINRISPEEDMLKFKPPYDTMYGCFKDEK